jgi:hypothetical protein
VILSLHAIRGEFKLLLAIGSNVFETTLGDNEVTAIVRSEHIAHELGLHEIEKWGTTIGRWGTK